MNVITPVITPVIMTVINSVINSVRFCSIPLNCNYNMCTHNPHARHIHCFCISEHVLEVLESSLEEALIGWPFEKWHSLSPIPNRSIHYRSAEPYINGKWMLSFWCEVIGCIIILDYNNMGTLNVT